jgi:hypothetical protein
VGRYLTPADVRAICDSLNDERGTGGQSKLARLLGWNYSTLWRKLNGKSPITQSYELAVRQAMDDALQIENPNR